MLKKFLAVVLSIAMVAALWTIPVAATSLEDTLAMDVDYSLQQRDDQTGTYTFNSNSYTDGDPFVYDNELDRYVNYNDGGGLDQYDNGIEFCGYNMGSTGLTIETLMKISPSNIGGNKEVFRNTGAVPIVGMTYYADGVDCGPEMRLWDGMTPNYGVLSTDPADGNYMDDQWHHIVVTADQTTEELYVDGVLADSYPRNSGIIGAAGRIVANGISLFDETEGYMAFFRIYEKRATSAEVATLYDVAFNPETITPEPTAAPTPAPLAVTYTMGENTAATADRIAIDTSFSYEWYGSLAGTEGTEVTILNMCLWQMEISPADEIYTWEFSTSSLAGVLKGAVASRDFVHVVFTAEDQHACWYVNGVLAAQTDLGFDANQPTNPSWAQYYGNFNFAHDVSAGLQIGKSNGTLNIYNRAATAAEVAAMYAAAAPTPEPTATPAPTPEPTPVPLAVTYTMDENTAATADRIAIDTSFSYEWYGSLSGDGEITILSMCLWQMEISPANEIYTWEFTRSDLAGVIKGSVASRDFVHVVFTAEDQHACWYVNGVLAAQTDLGFDANQPQNPSWAQYQGNFNFAHDVSAGLNIGKTNGVFNVYNRAATAAEVAAMYAAAAPTPAPTEAPTPTPEPTPVPLAVTSTLQGSAGATVLPINPSFSVEWFGDLTGTEGEITMISNGLYNLEISPANTIYTWEWATPAIADVLVTEVTRGFTHTVLTIDGRDAKFYVNGTLAGQMTLSFDGDTAQWNNCGVKGNYNWAYQFAAGLATNVTVGTMNIYNRAATAEEVADLYTAVVPVPLTPRDVVIASKPNKLNYAVGDVLDTTGLVVTARGEAVALADLTIGEFDSSTAGVKTIDVTYEGITKSFSVKVVESQLIGIKIESKPAKLIYWSTDEIDATGLVVLARYYNQATGAVTETAIDGYTLSEIDPTVEGVQAITVSYGGFTASFSIKVKINKVTALGLISKPAKLYYAVDEAFDATGLVLTAHYADGTTADVSEGFTVVAPTDTVGLFRATVSYGGVSTTFSYRVR